MRLLSLLGIVGYIALGLLVPKAGALPLRESPDVVSTEVATNRTLLNAVESAAVAGREGDCASLSPIALYQGSPSLDDWRTLCTAFVRRDAQNCANISAMLHPDLRGFCFASFSHS